MKYLNPLLTIICLIALTFTFSSCGDDDDDVTNLSLEGTLWTEISYEFVECDEPDDNDSDTSTCNSEECFQLFFYDGIFVFTATFDGIQESFSSTYTINGSQLVGTIFGSSNVAFSIAGNVLSLEYTNEDGCKGKFNYSGVVQNNPQEFLDQKLSEIQSIEGINWIQEAYLATDCINPDEEELFFCEPGNCDQLRLENGMITISEFEENALITTITGSYTIVGNTINVTFDEDGAITSLEILFSFVDGQMILIYTDPSTGCEIAQFYNPE